MLARPGHQGNCLYVGPVTSVACRKNVRADSWEYAAYVAVVLVGTQITFWLGRTVSAGLGSQSELPHIRQD